MSTQTLRDRALVAGVAPRPSVNWLQLGWAKLLTHKKQLMIGGGALAILAMAGFYFFGNRTNAPEYLTAKVERGNLRNTVTATGTLQAVTTVQVGSQASGTLSALNADFNSVVKKGQVIAQLDPSVSRAQVDQARANLEQARAGLQQARASVINPRRRQRCAGESARGQIDSAKQPGRSLGAQANLAVLKAQLDDAMSFLKQQESLLQRSNCAARLRHCADRLPHC